VIVLISPVRRLESGRGKQGVDSTARKAELPAGTIDQFVEKPDPFGIYFSKIGDPHEKFKP
jgi:hypothetical protein